MKPLFLLCSCFLLAPLTASAANPQSATTLRTFLVQRLAEEAKASPPSYQTLLQVTSTVSSSTKEEIAAALPSLFITLKHDERDLAVQAELPLFEIALRSDGGTLLRSRIDEIGDLLERSDERISGGGAGILRQLMASLPNEVSRILVAHLNSTRQPTLTKLELVAILLDFKKDDPSSLKAIEYFLTLQSDTTVKISTLKMIGAHQVNTAATSTFSKQALSDRSKYVKIAAIYAVKSLGSIVWSESLSTISKLASDNTEDEDVKRLANKALQNELFKASKETLTASPH